ncbi:hypothetical protein R1flu_012447 [Riccia fluitans]|uniref:DNA-directed RNA polymerase n=1 Tax=Riccia fluitans TaxID=41844 RepID=A0ABD1ZAU1_9MARC
MGAGPDDPDWMHLDSTASRPRPDPDGVNSRRAVLATSQGGSTRYEPASSASVVNLTRTDDEKAEVYKSHDVEDERRWFSHPELLSKPEVDHKDRKIDGDGKVKSLEPEEFGDGKSKKGGTVSMDWLVSSEHNDGAGDEKAGARTSAAAGAGLKVAVLGKREGKRRWCTCRPTSHCSHWRPSSILVKKKRTRQSQRPKATFGVRRLIWSHHQFRVGGSRFEPIHMNAAAVALLMGLRGGEIWVWIQKFCSIRFWNAGQDEMNGSSVHCVACAFDTGAMDNRKRAAGVTGGFYGTGEIFEGGINFQAANLTGQVPPGTLSNLTELKSLDLSRNNLTGDLQGIDNLSQLVFLNLSWNELNGPVLQNMVKLTMLNTLDLSHNKFSGNISGVFRDLVKLKFLDLSSNSFDGTIPVASICKPQSLKTVNLSSNSFTGNILTQPTDRCSKLETLDLSFNKLDGNLPAEIFQSRSKLKALYLQMNNFNGNLSVGAGQGQSIVEINLESNSFSGLIPQALWQFPNLTILKLGKNNFSGSLNISTFPASLLELDLHSKSFRATSAFGAGVAADNRFSSYSLPALGGLSKLEVLDLSGTNLTDTIPSSIGELNESLATLNLSRNSLGGDIPLEISTLKKLVLLDLSLNMLNGSISIPHSDGDLNETLTFLNLSWNRLGGEIPLLMGTLKKLVFLDLSHNKLEGEIPPNMVDLTLLSAVDLSNNNLSGVIPDKNHSSASCSCDSGISKKRSRVSLSSIRLNRPRVELRMSLAITRKWWSPLLLQFTWKIYQDIPEAFTNGTMLSSLLRAKFTLLLAAGNVQQPLCVPDHTSHGFTFLDVSRKNDSGRVLRTLLVVRKYKLNLNLPSVATHISEKKGELRERVAWFLQNDVIELLGIEEEEKALIALHGADLVQLVKTHIVSCIEKDEFFCGQNAVVAIACYTGYNQEDSIIMDQSALHRGMFRTQHYRTVKTEEPSEHETFGKPCVLDEDGLPRVMRSDQILEGDGLPFIGCKLVSNDYVISKVGKKPKTLLKLLP